MAFVVMVQRLLPSSDPADMTTPSAAQPGMPGAGDLFGVPRSTISSGGSSAASIHLRQRNAPRPVSRSSKSSGCHYALKI
jgi:hypothetical protein